MTGSDPAAKDFASVPRVLLAGITLVVVLALNKFLAGFLRSIAILLGLAIGTLLAIPFGLFDASALRGTPVFAVPSPFHFGAPEFQAGAIVSMLIVMLVSMTESTADMLALGEVVEMPVTEDTIAAGLRADGAATFVASLLNGFAVTAFAQNIGLIALTRVRSRYVVAVGGVILVLLGLFPVAGAIIAIVPQPVLGGAGFALFGTVAASGIRTLARAGLGDSDNLLIVAVALGFGLLPIAAPAFWTHFPQVVQTVMGSGISAGCLVAIALNLFFNHLGRRGTQRPAEVRVAEELAASVQ